MLICSSENRKIGDKIAGTGVYNLREYEGYVNQTNPTQPYKPKGTKMALIIVGAVLVVVIFIGAIFYGIVSVIRNHPSYHTAIYYIGANEEIAAIVGDIEGFGFMPSGSISTSPGRGDVSFSITVRGTDGNARVFVELQMHDGGWEVVRFGFVEI